MADISTAVSMARVPILGEDGRISDDYIPAAIGENVTKAESAATRAETAATDAEGSASAAGQSATQASGSASAASASASQAQQSAATAGGAATSAQSAQTAAEAAKTAAAGSAQDAQQSATEAAKSAASVADKFITSAVATTLEPGSQATASVENQVLTIGVPKGDKGDKGEKGDTGTGVPEGGTPGQLLSKTDSGTAWVDPPSGNVLTGTLGPAPVLSADDAYATKPRRLTVYGATRQNLWVNPSGAASGLTCTSGSDGSVTVSGTSTAQYATVSTDAVYTLKPSTQYTISIDKAVSNGAYFYLNEVAASGNVAHYVGGNGAGNSITFTTKSDISNAVLRFAVNNTGATVSGTYRVMLNEGSEPEPWCPPGLNSVGDDGSVKIVTAGKNLLARMGPKLPYTTAGITFSDNGDGGIRVSGTATAAAYYNFFDTSTSAAPYITSGTYVASLVGGIDSELNLSVGYFNGAIGDSYTLWLSTHVHDASNTGSIDRPVYIRAFISVVGGLTVDTVVYPQLELGSTATAYEPPAVTTTPIDLDGHALNSLPDGTRDELRIDGTGAVTLVQRVGVAAAPTEASGAAYLYPLAKPKEVKLPSVSLPTLPSPNITVYNDSDVPSDITLEYERDVTIAFGKLAKQIAGTASAVAVREASTIEEE